jgi:hypothetical protein
MLFRGQQQAQGQVSYCKMKGQPCYFEDSAISGTVLFRGQVSYYKVRAVFRGQVSYFEDSSRLRDRSVIVR